MRPRFHPRLINGPFDDPGLYIPFLFENRAVLCDLGDIYALSPKDILKISHVFVTHTHMDHFIGFDRLLRLFLGREKQLSVYGPQGFLKNAEGKLAGYAWNLVENYKYRLTLELTEVHSDLLITKTYHCRDKFFAREKTAERAFNGVLREEAGFRVYGVILDHNLPCLGFSIHEDFMSILCERASMLWDLKPAPGCRDSSKPCIARLIRIRILKLKSKVNAKKNNSSSENSPRKLR